jgi:DNA polymerase-1
MTDTIKIIASDLEFVGIHAEENLITEIVDFYQTEKEKYETKFKKRFKLSEEFNLNSSKQMQKLLYEDLNLPVLVRTKSDNPSCNEEAIRKLASKRPALRTLVDYRTVKGHIEKLKGYQRAIGVDGRVHSSFNIFSPDSSRLMSSKPNIQNVPRQSRIKEIFVPRPGYSYVYYDYSQIEFRIWLHLSNDSKGIDFVNKGRDIHAFIASQFYRQPEEIFLNKKDEENAEKRNKVKTIVYGSMYGRTPEGIVAEHGGSVEEAEQIQRLFFNLCREGWMWLKQIEQKVFSQKRLVTPFGTVRLFPDIELARGRQREEIVRQAKSFIVQSWAVEMVFIGMYKVWKAIREQNLDAHYIHQIHDGMILEVKDEHVAKVKRLVEEKAQSPYSKLKVPLTADLKVGKSWAEVA